MTLEEQIERLEEEKRKIVTIIRFSIWTPIVFATLCSLGVVPPMLFVIAYPIGIVVWSLRGPDRDRLEYAIDDLKKRPRRRL